MPNYGPKISNLPNKVKTMLMGSLLVTIDVLSTRMYFFLKLDKKWLSYGPKRYAQIWAAGATAKFYSFWPMTWSNISNFE